MKRKQSLNWKGWNFSLPYPKSPKKYQDILEKIKKGKNCWNKSSQRHFLEIPTSKYEWWWLRQIRIVLVQPWNALLVEVYLFIYLQKLSYLTSWQTSFIITRLYILYLHHCHMAIENMFNMAVNSTGFPEMIVKQKSGINKSFWLLLLEFVSVSLPVFCHAANLLSSPQRKDNIMSQKFVSSPWRLKWF